MDEQISQFYDDIAPAYDGAMSKGFISRLIGRRFREHLAAQFHEPKQVLDVGCGTGSDAIFLGKKGVNVFGFDISPGMIEIAKQKAIDAGLEPVVQFSVGDAADLSGLKDGSFDGAYANFNVVNHLPDVEKFAQTLSEKLCPGSPVVLTLMNRVCLPEVVGYMALLRFATAARKLRSRHDTLAVRMRLFFPMEAARVFEPYFSLRRVEGFGLLVPPAQLYRGKHLRRFFEWMAAAERPLLRAFPFYNLCDTYILILKKK